MAKSKQVIQAFTGRDMEGTPCLYIHKVNADGEHTGYLPESQLIRWAKPPTGPGAVKLKRMHSTKSRPNRGRAAFNAYCDLMGVPAIERKEHSTATDLITDVLHFAVRKGWNPAMIVNSALAHLEAETLVSCAKCGGKVERDNAIEDDGEGPEEGNTFLYCSIECRDRH